MTEDVDGATVLDEATSVLLLAPAVGDAAASATATLLDRSGREYDRAVAVTIAESVDSWIRAWERHADSTTELSCIDVECETRSTTVSGADSSTTAAHVERVSEPADLEQVGRRISEVAERASDDGDRVGLAVHSLTDLLQAVDEPTVFKFVYTLSEIFRRVDGTVYFHLDAAAHDEETVDTFRVVCDALVELDGEISVVDQRDQ
jgi:hypothetical protein